VGWSSVALIEVDIQAPKDWPTARMLQAERVTVVPSLKSLLTNEVRIASITIEKPYLAALRVPGKLLILPNLFEADKQRQTPETNGKESSRRSVAISRINLENGSMDIFDATVSRPPHKIRLEQIEAVVRDIAPANPQNRTRFEATGVAKGRSRDGQVMVSGWVAPGGKDSASHILLQGVDLVSLQPYLAKKGEARVSKGSLDLDLKSEVTNNNLNGVGKMILRQLEFAPSQNYMDTFMGAPRSAVIGFLKDHNNAINIDFTLNGDIRNPKFSLNEALSTRIAAAMAGQLGLSFKGVAESVESLSRKGLESASGAAGAIGSAFKGFFGSGKQ
jgi:hypothetical protein